MKYLILFLFPISILAQDYKSLLIKFEGYKNVPYYDTRGNLTVGIGHLLPAQHKNFYSNKEVDNLFQKDLNNSLATCHKLYYNFNNYSTNIRLALASLAFQLGPNKLKKFIKFNATVNENNWPGAQNELTNSKLMLECPNRTRELIKLLNLTK